ncbi:MAG: hypothetical protein Q9191_002312 [Dirinaria sp. TL-2023a]
MDSQVKQFPQIDLTEGGEGALITGGIMISYWLDFGFSFLDPNPVAWRFPIAFQIFFALVILLFILELPESPRWLVLKGKLLPWYPKKPPLTMLATGKEDEAVNVLAALSDLPPDDPYINSEFTAIKDTVLEMSKGSFSDLFTMTEDRHLHRTVLAYVNQMFQQISGINLITYYAATIYQNEIGLSGFTSRILAAANGTEYFLASWIAVFTIEKFGRRQLMLFGAAGQSFSMIILAIMDSIGGKGPGIVAALFLFIFNSFFAVGWLGMTWLYPAEIVPLRIRAPANALSTSANWAFNFMVVMVTPVAFTSIGYKTYIIFAVIIFHKTHGAAGWMNVVKVARDEPHRYDKDGRMIIAYDETDEHAQRQASVVSETDMSRAAKVAAANRPSSDDDAEKGIRKEVE